MTLHNPVPYRPFSIQLIDLDVDRDLAVFRVCVPVGLDGYLLAAEILHSVAEELHRLSVEEMRAALLEFVLKFTGGHVSVLLIRDHVIQPVPIPQPRVVVGDFILPVSEGIGWL